jgi:hypothetical protein
MAKTVMQAFIERVRAQYESVTGTGDAYDMGQDTVYEAILNDAEEMIKQEKQMIAEAYMIGSANGILTGKVLDGNEFYNKTYGEI